MIALLFAIAKALPAKLTWTIIEGLVKVYFARKDLKDADRARAQAAVNAWAAKGEAYRDTHPVDPSRDPFGPPPAVGVPG